jgi:hypothetical protein
MACAAVFGFISLIGIMVQTLCCGACITCRYKLEKLRIKGIELEQYGNANEMPPSYPPTPPPEFQE